MIRRCAALTRMNGENTIKAIDSSKPMTAVKANRCFRLNLIDDFEPVNDCDLSSVMLRVQLRMDYLVIHFCGRFYFLYNAND